MTPRQKKLHVEEIRKLIESAGFKLDSYGNYTRMAGDCIYRIKVKKINLRIEFKFNRRKATWYKISSEPIVNIDLETLGGYLSMRFETNI